MALTPEQGDKEEDLYYKVAKNLYDFGVGLGLAGLVEPVYGSPKHALLKNAVNNSAIIAS